MSKVDKVKLLSERTSGVPPVIFIIISLQSLKLNQRVLEKGNKFMIIPIRKPCKTQVTELFCKGGGGTPDPEEKSVDFMSTSGFVCHSGFARLFFLHLLSDSAIHGRDTLFSDLRTKLLLFTL